MAIAAQWQNELTGMALSIYESTMEKIYVRQNMHMFPFMGSHLLGFGT